MKLLVKGRNVEVTDALQDYAEKRLAKISRQLDDDVTRVELEITEERNRRVANRHVAEATIWTKGPTLRAREASDDMYASIDMVAEKLLRQVTKLREKRLQYQQRGGAHGPGHGRYKSVPAGETEAASALLTGDSNGIAFNSNDHKLTPMLDGGDPGMTPDTLNIVKTKQFRMGPMSPEDAALQMELIGHDFFVFVNAENNQTCVLYKRSDGQLGLIEPTMAEVEA